MIKETSKKQSWKTRFKQVLVNIKKMKKQQTNFNWYFILTGILILYFGLTNNQQINKSSSVAKITVKLDKDIINVKGRTSSIDYKIWTKEYKNQFNILNGSINRNKYEAISELKSGQILKLYIKSSDLNNLLAGKEDIDIIGIRQNGISLMTPNEFYLNRNLYNVRIKIFSVFTALMLLLNGLTNIQKKINYIIIGVFIGAIIIMRILEIVIY